MSEETATRETWRPDAEPWEALKEASIRGSALPFGERTGRRLAECLSEMGWRLVPEAHIKEALDEIKRRRARDDYEYLHHEEQCAHGSTLMRLDRAEERVRELEAENERLRDETQIAAGYIASLEMGEYESGKRIEFLEAENERLRSAAHHGELYASVPVPEGPEGGEALEGLKRKIAALNPPDGWNQDKKYGWYEAVDEIYHLICLESPAPVPVEEPETGLISEAELRKRNEMPSPAPSYVKHVDAAETDLEDRHNSAPEIKVGQVWRRKKDGYTARVKEIEGTTVWLVDVDDGSRVGTWFKSGLRTDWELVSEPEHSAPEIKVGQVLQDRQVSRDWALVTAIARNGGVWLRLSQFPDEGSRPFTDDYVRTYFDVVYDPPDRSPSLDLEGLAELDAEIERLQREARDGQLGLLRDLAQKKADAYRQAREWLVSTPGEEADGER